MNQTANSFEVSSLPNILSLFEDLLGHLPKGAATLQQDMQPDGEIHVRIIPTNQDAAMIAGRGGGNLRYDLIIGQGTTFEILPQGMAYTRLSGYQEARLICESVFAGNFEEECWMVGANLAKTIGKIMLEGQTVSVRVIHGFYPLRRKRKTRRRYAPYAPLA